ncbi:hypothetical protein ARMSODRAFT_1087854 [Armillaria solidipes]|uniref:Uncharacterized protein n=1 Tax=Armillaria solidipes TaxID=1076256 RepID=A0A2H3B1J6_9AGAR|nr:hypothetical protein ARMSODRAFT_965590 [Armillaria solidipes]PBK61557.1 hypothetical protein ARMSODRAFT_1089550 [Armillaria solidipes]PBK64421.1 hypothetical protein ARMSODRAFT_1087854 [Armillaria solidipes]
MVPTTCTVDGVAFTLSICLERAQSVSKMRSGPSTVFLVTSRASFSTRIVLHNDETISVDVCLGLDWLMSLLGQADGAVPSDFDCLRTVSRLFFEPGSSHFFYNLPYSTIVYELAGHGLLHKTSCRQEHVFRNLLVEHFLAGMCASNNGPFCRSYVQACHRGRVRPPVFFLSALHYSGALAIMPPPALKPFWHFLTLSTTSYDKRDRTLLALSNRLKVARYLQYKGDVTYMAAMFDAAFETLRRDDLVRMMCAHGMTSSGVSSTVDDIKEALSDHVFGGLCADGLRLPVSKIPVGCLDCLHEFAFSDRVRSRNVRWLS